jgi:hypothetical protein
MSRNSKARAISSDSDGNAADSPDETGTECAELAEIDMKAVNDLVGIKQKQTVVQGYRDRAQELKGKANQIVHRRVTQDYERRYADLESQAVPLRADARKEYGKLRTVHGQLQKAFDEVSLDKEELEFRHAVGELGADDLKDRLEQCEQLLERRRGVLAQAEKLKQMFVGAFHSQEELEARSEPDVSTNSASVSAAASSAESKPGVPGPSTDSKPHEPATPAADLTLTPAMAPQFGDETLGAEPLYRSEAADGDSNANSKTFVVPEAVLLIEHGEAPVEHRLSVLNYIGRTKDNQVQIPFPGVSRRHALVSAGPGGFTLADLGSQNGTLVNDKPITQCTLNEGDRIKIGEVHLVFHLAQHFGA